MTVFHSIFCVFVIHAQSNGWLTFYSCIVFYSTPWPHFILSLLLGIWLVPFLLLQCIYSEHSYTCLLAQMCKCIYSGIYLEVELLGHRLCESSTVLENAYLFSKVGVLVYILTCSALEFLVLHHYQQIILLNLWIISYSGFKSHFINKQWVWASFNIYLPFIFPSVKCLFITFAYFSIWLFIFFLKFTGDLYYIFYKSSFPDICISNISPSLWFAFHSLYDIFKCLLISWF